MTGHTTTCCNAQGQLQHSRHTACDKTYSMPASSARTHCTSSMENMQLAPATPTAQMI